MLPMPMRWYAQHFVVATTRTGRNGTAYPLVGIQNTYASVAHNPAAVCKLPGGLLLQGTAFRNTYIRKSTRISHAYVSNDECARDDDDGCDAMTNRPNRSQGPLTLQDGETAASEEMKRTAQRLPFASHFCCRICQLRSSPAYWHRSSTSEGACVRLKPLCL